MYTLTYKTHFDAAHSLELPYESKCQNLHGHRWEVIVIIKTQDLNQDGMIIDFSKIKEIVNVFDHTCLNDIVEQPTAENLSLVIQEEIEKSLEGIKADKVSVEIFESPNASIRYENC